MVDLAHFACFLINSSSDTSTDAISDTTSSSTKPVRPVYVNASAAAMPQNDGCGCSPGEGWSMTDGGCSAQEPANWGVPNLEYYCALNLARMSDDGDGAAAGLSDGASGRYGLATEHCTTYLWFDTVIALLPFIFRFLQCVRRHCDEHRAGKPPTQLYNACKYGTCIVVILLSWADHKHTSESTPPAGFDSWDDVTFWAADGLVLRPFHTCWVLMVVVSTLYKLYWDFKHDWGFTSVTP